MAKAIPQLTDAASYLADWPDREADCVAMGWTNS